MEKGAALMIGTRCFRAILVLTLALAAAAGTAHGQTDLAAMPGGIYRLEKGTSFQRGCFDPCLCPILAEVPVRGTFQLTPAGFDGLFQTYKVTDINWTVSLGDPELRITGSGTYKLGGEFALQQELSLDLQIGDDPPQRFESGRVAPGARFPSLSATVSVNKMFCFDTVIAIEASPVPPAEIHPYQLLRDSTFQRGCFGACDCLLREPQPVVGTFALVDLQENPLFSEFAVVNVRWRTASTLDLTTKTVPIRGFGTYLYGGEFALVERLSLDLEVDGEPLTHYDSGLVPAGAAFPRIDTSVSIDNLVCYDTLIHVDALPRLLRPRRRF
jgi:hypothetical protein